jgi:hypothetical protein
LSIRQQLWKQVNKKITKVKYTFNPTLYEHSFFYDDSPVQVEKTVVNVHSDDAQWSNIASEIDWSCLLNNTIPDKFEYNQNEEFNLENELSDSEDKLYEIMWN